MVTLTTERLVLRPLTLDDTDALLAIWGDAETMRFYPAPLTREGMIARIAQQMERYASGTGLLGLVLKQTSELIGDCGPVWHEIDGVQELEVGYHVRRDHWGKGYAPEAARAVLNYIRQTLEYDRCISLIRVGNMASRRTAEKNGAVFEKTALWRGMEHWVLRYPPQP